LPSPIPTPSDVATPSADASLEFGPADVTAGPTVAQDDGVSAGVPRTLRVVDSTEPQGLLESIVSGIAQAFGL